MRSNSIGREARIGILLVGAFSLAIAVLTQIEGKRQSTAASLGLASLPSGNTLKVATLGYAQVVADVLWIRVLPILGEREASLQDYRAAYRGVDVLTDLDPQFAYAYQVAGSILGIWSPLVDEGIALLQKGMRHNPEVWQLPFYVGYLYAFERNNPERGAHFLRMAALLPGVPEYLPKLAARMTVDAGDPVLALEFLDRLLARVDNPRLREGLERRRQEVVTAVQIRLLEAAVRRYQTQFGKVPPSLQALVDAGMVPAIPIAPLGGTFVLTQDGTVTNTRLPEGLKVYRK